jgi:hypothetical protein
MVAARDRVEPPSASRRPGTHTHTKHPRQQHQRHKRKQMQLVSTGNTKLWRRAAGREGAASSRVVALRNVPTVRPCLRDCCRRRFARTAAAAPPPKDLVRFRDAPENGVKPLVSAAATTASPFSFRSDPPIPAASIDEPAVVALPPLSGFFCWVVKKPFDTPAVIEPKADAPDCEAPESSAEASRVYVLRRCSIGRRRGASSAAMLAPPKPAGPAPRTDAGALENWERELAEKTGAIMFVTSSSISLTSTGPTLAEERLLASSCGCETKRRASERRPQVSTVATQSTEVKGCHTQ